MVGTSYDTSEFAVDAIIDWWRREGRRRYGPASELLILADSGGCNRARGRLWECALQDEFVDRFGLAVTVCHYSTGASKWNPIEHRLFCEISKHWAGQPLADHPTVGLIGIQEGGRQVRGSVTAASLSAAETWAKQQRGLLTGDDDGNFLPVAEEWDRNYPFVPRVDGIVSGVGANVKLYRVSFAFGEILPNYAAPA